MKPETHQQSFHLTEPSDNARVVFSARQLLDLLEFDEIQQYLIAAAVSELSTNIIRYAGEGTISLRGDRDENGVSFEVVANDCGPGIVDIDAALKEKYSTGNGLGLGLPSVQRIMDEFEVRSTVGEGTIVTAKIWKNKCDFA